MNLVMKQKSIVQRGKKVRKMLKAISKNSDGPAWQFSSMATRLVLAAHDGSPASSGYNNWRFSTTNSNLQAQYYERWEQLNINDYYLERVYLHLFQINKISATEKEYLLLHCDPNEPEHANHYIYKRNPHLHISVAEQPIPHSHFALCLSNIEDVLSSIDRLDDTLGHILFMLKDQVLDMV